MLYRIIEPDYFGRCMEEVKRAFWPEERFLAQRGQLPTGLVGVMEDQILERTGAALRGIVKTVADEPFYAAFDQAGAVRDMALPFLDRYYELFLRRKWEQPYPDPQAAADDLFRLSPDPKGGNYSRNNGNYNHFVNVVAALARLVMFFQDPENVRKLFENRLPQWSALAYDQSPDLRTFKLMLAGFYHDIGKAIVDPRHAMEGAILLAHHTTSARYSLHQIAQGYSPRYQFERDDLFYVADLVLFHDHYGTLSTGEDGYLPLVNLIDRIKRYSLDHNANKADQLEWSRCYVFDLWLLNAADIMVSLAYKFELQDKWWSDPHKAEEKILSFLRTEKAGNLVHDLKITFQLLEVLCQKKHADDLVPLQSTAHEISKRHGVERLHRLVTESLIVPLKKYSTDQYPKLQAIAKQLETLSEQHWTTAIVRAIQAVADVGEFTHRFAWIGRMDYALGFFQRIADEALKRVEQELQGQDRTGWIRYSGASGTIDPDYLSKTQALFFADNYVMCLLQILDYLLFRESSLDRLRNIEFSDACNRLTPEKLAQLLSTEGPFRSRRAAQAILQTIYLY